LIDGSNDAGQAAARSVDCRVRDFARVPGRLDEQHAVPAVSRHRDDRVGLESGGIRGLHRLAPILESGGPRICPQEHGRLGARCKERLEGLLVAAAQDPDHARNITTPRAADAVESK